MNGFAWLTEALPWKSEGRRKQRRRRRGDVENQSLICIPPVNAMPSTTYRINLNHLKLRKRTRQVNISSSRVMTWPFCLTMEITCHYLIGWRAMWLCRFTQVRIDLTIDLGRAWWFEAKLIFYYKIVKYFWMVSLFLSIIWKVVRAYWTTDGECDSCLLKFIVSADFHTWRVQYRPVLGDWLPTRKKNKELMDKKGDKPKSLLVMKVEIKFFQDYGELISIKLWSRTSPITLFSIFNEIFPNQKIGVIIVGSVQFLPKKSKLIFKKKNQNWTETSSKRPVSVRFGYFRAKTKNQPIGLVFLFGLIFSV